MARLRHRRALEARLDKLERTVSAALAQRAPKPQDRASAQALIRKHEHKTTEAGWYCRPAMGKAASATTTAASGGVCQFRVTSVKSTYSVSSTNDF